MIPLVDVNDSKSKKDVLASRKCFRCGRTTTFVDPKTGVAAWRKRKIKEKWDGENYYCDSCYHKLKKQIRDGTLDKNSNKAKGDRVEKAFEKVGFRNCNKEKDNYNFVYDLYDSVKYKRVQVRSTEIKPKIRHWKDKEYTYFGWHLGLDMEREYDYLFAVCMSENYEDIDRIYVIPVNRLPDSEGIIIYRDQYTQYEDCRDEELLKKVKEAYRM